MIAALALALVLQIPAPPPVSEIDLHNQLVDAQSSGK